MKADSFDAICTRTISVSDGREVEIQIGKPMQEDSIINETRRDSYCPYRIKGIGNGKVRKIWGIDGFQAIQLAMSAIGAELYSSDEASEGHLMWEAGNVPGDLGFPVPSGLASLVPSGASGQ
jgi:hypothetical protein